MGRGTSTCRTVDVVGNWSAPQPLWAPSSSTPPRPFTTDDAPSVRGAPATVSVTLTRHRRRRASRIPDYTLNGGASTLYSRRDRRSRPRGTNYACGTSSADAAGHVEDDQDVSRSAWTPQPPTVPDGALGERHQHRALSSCRGTLRPMRSSGMAVLRGVPGRHAHRHGGRGRRYEDSGLVARQQPMSTVVDGDRHRR